MSDSKPLSHVIGGFFGGLASSVTLQPFDLLKTRVQQQHSGTVLGTIRSLKSYKELWRGTLPSALRTSVGSAMYLSSLHVFRSLLANTHASQQSTKGTSSLLPKLSMVENLVTGAVTRGTVGFLTMPITVLKVRFESTMYHYTSLSGGIKSIWQTEGLNGFFRGFTATCIRDAPYAGLYVLFYEQCKVMLPNLLPTDALAPVQHILSDGKTPIIPQEISITKAALINTTSAFAAASIATTITAPFDTVKTRMQLQPKVFKSFVGAFGQIVSKEGTLRLFDGLSLRLTRKAFSAGIAWGIYEEIIKFVTKL